MAPAMLAEARIVDQILLGQTTQFLDNTYGTLAGLTSSNARDSILGTRKRMNINKAYMQNRNLILTPNSETSLLNLDLFTQAQQVGDDGTALREASLGRKLGFDMFMCQNAMSVASQSLTTLAGTVNHSGGYAKGITVLTVAITGTVTVGNWVTIAGDGTPYRVVALTAALGSTTSITLHRGLANAVANSAAITVVQTPGVNNGAKLAGYSNYIETDGWSTDIPQVGQPITFGLSTTPDLYTIIQVDANGSGDFLIYLDRPLVNNLADNAVINLGPVGDYNFAFHRNALALVVRPLAMPRPGTGALSAVVNFNDLSMRATITYDGNKQGHLVTLDMLLGIAILDRNLGAVMLG